MIVVFISPISDFTAPEIAYDTHSEESMELFAEQIFNLIAADSDISLEDDLKSKIRKACRKCNWDFVDQVLAHLDYCVQSIEIL